MDAGVRTACACEISKAMELKAFCGSPSATRLKKVVFSRQSCLFLPNEMDSKNIWLKHPAHLLPLDPRVTATGVDSAGPIGRAHKGIDFCPRMGDRWAYLEVYTPRSQSSEKDLPYAPVTVRISMVSDTGEARHLTPPST